MPPDGAAEIRRLVAEAPEVTEGDTWPEPDMRLVEDDRSPAPALDDDALPAGWAGGSRTRRRHAAARATTWPLR